MVYLTGNEVGKELSPRLVFQRNDVFWRVPDPNLLTTITFRIYSKDCTHYGIFPQNRALGIVDRLQARNRANTC